MQINDVQVIPLTVYEDDRGTLMEIARATVNTGEPHAVVHEFGQQYVVSNPTAGVIRAFHKHQNMWDFFCIVHGKAKFVLVDDRKNSSTYEQCMEIIASQSTPKLIVVPPGVWHGWMSLVDDTQLLSIASKPYDRYNPDEERIPYDSFEKDFWRVQYK